LKTGNSLWEGLEGREHLRKNLKSYFGMEPRLYWVALYWKEQGVVTKENITRKWVLAPALARTDPGVRLLVRVKRFFPS